MIAAACGIGITIAACGGGDDATPEANGADPAPVVTVDGPEPPLDPAPVVTVDGTEPPLDAAATETLSEAPALLQFSAPLVGGGDIDATSLAGQPTVCWVWAPT